MLLMGLVTLCEEALADVGQEPLRAHLEHTWSVDAAKDKLFEQAPEQLETGVFSAKDPYFEEHFAARLSLNTRIGERVLCFFDNGDYAYYTLGQYQTFYYHSDGTLYKVSVSNQPKGMDQFPVREIGYSYPKGNIVTVGLFVSLGESFVFNPEGDLMAHWLWHKAYDDQGQILRTRTWVEPVAQGNLE